MKVEEPRLTASALKLMHFLITSGSPEKSGAAISKATGIGAGTLYPLLARFEDAKWIVGTWEQINPAEVGRPRRRFYELTNLGVTRSRGALAAVQLPPTRGALAWKS